MTITATEFKNKLGYYLERSMEEDIYISKNNKIISILTSPTKNRVQIAKSLFGSIPNNYSLEDAKDERSKSL